MATNHFSPKEIDAFVTLTLNKEENERILAHIDHCDACLELVDVRWEREVEDDNLSKGEARQALERRLFNHIYRSNLAGQLIHLSTHGIFSVFLALLHPLLRNYRDNGSSASRHK